VEGESSEPAAAGAGQGVDPAGVAIALDAAAHNARSGALTYLDEAGVAAHRREVATNGFVSANNYFPDLILPLRAEALARLGHFAEAGASLKTLASDCDRCARVQRVAAALRHDWPRADRWFALVAARSPDVPYSDWGMILLWNGDYDAAIAKFAAAHRISSHFADLLEMWGEALMQKGRSDLALAKFDEANKYTPNWGRLHLEWGKALGYLGRHGDAKKQFELASQLDLSAGDAAALARQRAAHA